MTTKTISLHCPSRNLTIPAFVISPFQKLDQVLQAVRLALDIPYAAIYTVDAKHVTDPQSLDDGQRVLVAVNEDEEMLPDAQERGCVVYLGEEGDEEMWEMLNDMDKTTHMIDLITNDPPSRNILRLTRTWDNVRSEMHEMFSDIADCAPLIKPEAHRRDSSNVMVKDIKTKAKKKDIAASMQEMKITEQEEKESDEDFHSLIETRWELTVEAFLHPVTAHHKTVPKNKPAAHIPEVIVAALALMASVTHGQPRLARDILEEAIRLRVDATAQSASPTGTNASPASSGSKAATEKDIFALIMKVDVNNAIEIMYERAGVLVANLTKEKKKKAGGKEKGESGRERRKRAKEARRSGGMGA